MNSLPTSEQRISNGITIGVPVYNEERYIEAAVRSAVHQCEALFISDNASTDGTAAICSELSREFPSLKYIRQPTNRGALDNFGFVLEQASTSKFMWLGGHDMLPDHYVERLDSALDSTPEAALAYGAARHIDRDGSNAGWYEYHYHELLSNADPVVRVQGMVRHLRYCSLIHGLFRTEKLREAWESDIYLGVDNVILTKAARKSCFVYVPDTYLIRRNAHPGDTIGAQLERLSGRAENANGNHEEMQRRLYSQIASATAQMGAVGRYIRLKTRLVLIGRHGPYGVTSGGRTLARMAYAVFTVIRGIRSRTNQERLFVSAPGENTK